MPVLCEGRSPPPARVFEIKTRFYAVNDTLVQSNEPRPVLEPSL